MAKTLERAHKDNKLGDTDFGQYVKIPGTKVLINPNVGKEFYGPWEEAHFKLSEKGLFMPTPSLFAKYFVGVVNSAKGDSRLYNGLGEILPKGTAEVLYHDLIQSKSTWLDALFVKGSGYKNLDIKTNHRAIIEGERKGLIGSRMPLEECLMEEGLAKLEFNSQGLPTKKEDGTGDPSDEESQPWFIPPKEGKVAVYTVDWQNNFYSCNQDLPLDPIKGDTDNVTVFPCLEMNKQ